MIKPTVGRVVWFRPYIKPGMLSAIRVGPEWTECDNELPHVPGQPLAAIVAAVWEDDIVSLTVFDSNGRPHARPNVLLWHGEGEHPVERRYCEWMPYQKGQAAKTEELEKRRPTIEELEAILRSEEKLAIIVQPDGSIRAEPIS